MTASLSGVFSVQQFTDIGDPLVGGRLYTYEPSTTTHKTAYTNAAATVAHTYTSDGLGGQYIALDSRGELPAGLFLTAGGYDLALKTAAGATVWTRRAIGGSDTGNTLRADLIDPSGSSIVGFAQEEAGAVGRTVEDKLREFVHIDDFGPNADGSDDLAALTAFFNSANARPGVPHFLGNATYGTSGALPSITSNNVLIYGATGGNRGVGSQTGSIIKALSGATGTIIDVSPVEGASAQCLQGVKIIGLTIDCNNIAAYGIVIRSVRESEFETCVLNATNTGLYLGVVNTLGEAADLQRTIFRHVGVQIAAPSGVAIRLTGTTTANVSFCTFEYVDVVHTNASAIIEENADNNLWLTTRTFCAGTATNSIEWLGGASSAVACRDEHFIRLSTNKAAIAKGTGSYTAPATNIVIDNMDITNSSPIATEETGATIYDGKWRAYTPTLTAQSGTLSSATASMRYMRELRLMNFSAVVTTANIGTASGSILATLPSVAANNTGSAGGGAGLVTATGAGVTSFINQGASQIVFRKSSDGSFPLANGQTLVAYGSYEIA